MYLTIEPFCAEQNSYEFLKLIKEKGIKKIYIGMQDPNPGNKIDFISELEKLGISYEFGLCGDECEELNEIYSYYIQNKSPYVIVKWAMTLYQLRQECGNPGWRKYS